MLKKLRGNVEMPKTQWLGDIPGFSRDQLLAYGDARALAASEQDRAFIEAAFKAHPNLDLDVEAAMKRGEA